jgi:hypothetical protein
MAADSTERIFPTKQEDHSPGDNSFRECIRYNLREYQGTEEQSLNKKAACLNLIA